MWSSAKGGGAPGQAAITAAFPRSRAQIGTCPGHDDDGDGDGDGDTDDDDDDADDGESVFGGKFACSWCQTAISGVCLLSIGLVKNLHNGKKPFRIVQISRN